MPGTKRGTYDRTVVSELYRWQAAMGALTGALVGGAVSQQSDRWTPNGMAAITQAEDLLAGRPTPIDLAPELSLIHI